MKNIIIGNDHAAFEMKEFVISEFTKLGYNFTDMGCYSSESVDYTDYIHPVAKAVSNGDFEIAIILCGSGNGASITANKYKGNRSVICWNEELAMLGRAHNNANILALPARFIDNETAKKIISKFLSTDFEGGRHARRVEKIEG